MSALHEAHRKLPPCGGAVLAAALMLVPLWPVGAVAQGVQGSCVVNRATFRAQTSGGGSTNSTTFVNIPQTALDVTVGGANPTCAIVVFTAQTQTTADENMVVRARIPGIGIGVPAEFALGTGTGATESRPAQFVFENVPPGTYTVRMQYRSVPGTTVTITRPTVVVHHR
ncbi:MAG: hypothetical protein GEU91_21370 [Rhizobiales bacterium]|nr:hypothetical protein [Hyphomicrobiales bacterium]